MARIEHSHPGHRSWRSALILAVAGTALSGLSRAQSTSSYDALIQQGQAQLQSNGAESALRSGEAAIHIEANRWEGHALAGGALMNLNRYEEAIDDLSRAIELAPDDKKAGLRDLRRQCLQMESRTVPVPASKTETTATQPEIVLWKSIENSVNITDFQAYQSQYPNGAFAPLAQQRVTLLRERQVTESQALQQRLVRALTWIDASTGLMWQRRSDDELLKEGRYQAYLDNKPTFSDVASYCASLHLLDYTNWRVPTADEVTRVFHRTGSLFGSGPPLTVDGNLFEEPFNFVWSSTQGDKDTEMIGFRYGHRESKDKTSPGFGTRSVPLCVRGTTPT